MVCGLAHEGVSCVSEVRVGTIGNSYGNLFVKEDCGKFFWSIEDWNGRVWEEIPESLYRQLIAFANSTSTRHA